MSSVHATVAGSPVSTTATISAPADRRAYRMSSLDMLRGLVMVVMALDHVRDFVMTAAVQDPTADPASSPLLFATRWITHFCAPTFVFLAGTSAGLMSRRKSPAELASFLLTRGLWLIVLEVLVVSPAWSFAPMGIPELGGQTYIGLQVIWVIGASMVILAGAQFLGRHACLLIGVMILMGHNLLDGVWPAASTTGSTGPLWAVLHARQLHEVGFLSVFFSYPLLPWTGVMLAGYGAAGLFELPEKQRNTLLVRIGAGVIIAFVLIRALNVYGDPHPWQSDASGTAASVMSFLATTKYPPSLLYVLMTLGPAALACAFIDRLQGPIRTALVTFGRAPLAFYLAHLYLIHSAAILLGIAQGFPAQQFLTHYRYFPTGFGVGLLGVYLVWIAVVAALYPLCRWIADLKARRQDWWLSYV
ncbi:putative membrane protein [Povalibacter uvarum]|uniref:Putative membrane protein n=1 Tax=Povalibacter uvarum TaxID=732238 RepID=A0A841HVL1_9GAMM|nr:heparan-alpha-glucosaminide N-acetyltransferase domain-containing protein [Povalibacter uvarum]MBB6096230.1 putative membrane protein [Povalibacter uvarum]